MHACMHACMYACEIQMLTFTYSRLEKNMSDQFSLIANFTKVRDTRKTVSIIPCLFFFTEYLFPQDSHSLGDRVSENQNQSNHSS